ncbi:MAG: DNA recombination protein RmuC [Bacteroidales bacterium]|jgi:DNA recombination protein RmuC|nr:DNA recombination protein RmuC [Bacteroidales bacterium]
MNTYIIIAAAAAVIIAVVITWLIMRAHEVKACNELENKLIGAQKDLENAQKLQKMQQESFAQQLDAVKSQLSAETEKLLKQREESLQQKAEETFKNLTGPLGKDLKSMQESFDAQKRIQAEGTASLKTAMEQAVKHLQDQTQAIGTKADNLAQALKGQNKMAGTWGEIILYNMLVSEGMVEGRDFDKEETLRDGQGSIVYNEDSGKRMRPDYILHYPDKTEVIIDAKTSMEALSDWVGTEDPIRKEDAAKRNLLAIRTQIKSLSGKRYQDYIREGYKTLDYVIMFIPNYSSLQLAKTMAPNLFNEAYQQGVLLTTEETLMPFLRMIRVAWTNYDQVRNQEKIIKAAQTMVDRVYDFARAHAAMGDKLHAALDEYEKVSLKVGESGNSILTSARQLIKLGVPKNPKKPLPDSEE